MTPALLRLLLTDDPTAQPCDTVTAWWEQYLDLEPAWPRPVERAIVGGYCADRVGWAFASAYQAALRALVPTVAADRVTALCVTEEQGTAPRAMHTTLTDDGAGGFFLSGAKRWTTLGPDGGLFLVAARDGRSGGERPVIRLVQVPADTAGLQIQPMPPTAFVPEVPHARLHFDRVALPAAALLPGDGYSRYVKPFRTVEDLHVHAGVLAYLVRESRRLAWPRQWTERAVAALLAFSTTAELDPAAATTHVALAGTMALGEQLVAEADSHWGSTSNAAADPSAAARWQRDRKLLTLAAQARAARIEKAWTELA